ncbi:FCD domain-containing protein [Rhizobiales bacterium RZME27]|uniref:FCD domain-containing protein n=2 Tax=Endobacterium cereale TaxID=2663029 RepID=A0A6A8ABC2_9HYPH|nr:FCD domain-containing protein [Endobacterium cereale]
MSGGVSGTAWSAARLEGVSDALNASQRIHVNLRNEIISMRRRPGDPIHEKDIAQTCGVSRTPVREALLRLSEEGLVDIIAKSGTRVSRIPVNGLPEAILARKAIEQMTARMAAELAAKSDILTMQAIVERQAEALRSCDFNGFHENDEALHQAIMRTAGYVGIWRFVEEIKVQLDRFRRLTLPQAHRMERALSEHVRLVEAIDDRNQDMAATVMGEHLDWLGTSLAGIQHLNPDYFRGDPRDAHPRWMKPSSTLSAELNAFQEAIGHQTDRDPQTRHMGIGSHAGS